MRIDLEFGGNYISVEANLALSTYQRLDLYIDRDFRVGENGIGRYVGAGAYLVRNIIANHQISS